MAKGQQREGAHVLDVCVDYVGRDGVTDMDEVASRFATQAAVPLVLDSTEPEVMEAGLRWLGGRAILNSANLEDGEAEGSRLDRVMRLAREYGAAVVCLLIDEEGQARDVDWKMRIAHRIHDLATLRYGLEPGDLIFDALTFPLSTGDDDLRGDALATIEAIGRIKAELPGVSTVLGVSNVSFGLKPAARHVLNSVFLHECVEAGLDAAIVHAARILPLNRIPDQQRQVCLDLIYDRRRPAQDGQPAYDPLTRLLELFEDVEAAVVQSEDRSGWPVEQRLSQRIIDGDRDGLTGDLDEALGKGTAPLAIINDVLLAGMKVVGELFGAGEMQLPFVLQSAETMKTAVAHLEAHMDRVEGAGKGRIVLATVKGDVHDIGKNLVDIILTNNGYEVHNLGIKVGIGEMTDKALEVGADAIGMSGLLVKSTLIMRDNLEELNQRGLASIPVLLGGAALTRSYVERDLREVYEGRLFYGKDAFEGLHTMDRLGAIRRGEEADDPDLGSGALRVPGAGPGSRPRCASSAAASTRPDAPERSPEAATDNDLFTPPFLGSRVVKGIAIDTIAEYLNETALFRNQWQFRPEKRDESRRDASRPVSARRCASSWPRPKPTTCWSPRSCTATSRPTATATTSSSGTTRTAGPSGCGSPSPARPPTPWLCIADFFRPAESGEPDYAAFQIVTMGAAVSDRTAELFADGPLPGVPAGARPRCRDGRGAGRALAQTHPRRVGLRRPGRPQPRRASSASSTAAAATRGATRPAPTSRTT